MDAHKSLIILLCIVTMLLAGACSKKEAPAVQPEIVEKTPSAPDFPKDIPIYEYSRNVEIQRSGPDARATFITSMDGSAVVNYYDMELVRWGWKKIGYNEQGERTCHTYRKNKRVFHLYIKTDRELVQTHVTLVVNG